MKNRLQVASVIALAALAAASVEGGNPDAGVSWWPIDKVVPVGDGGIFPRIAVDGAYGGGAIIMFEWGGPGVSTIGYETGNTNWSAPPLEPSVDWCCSPGNNMNNEMGRALSVGLVSSSTWQIGGYDTAIEVHQGEADQLWYSVGSAKVNTSQNIAVNVDWASSQSYDRGFNPTVGVDNSQGGAVPPAVSAAAVEVHQAQSGSSELWYHFGLLMGIHGSSPSMTWFPSTPVQYTSGSTTISISGNHPSVSLSNGLAFLVFEGGSGDLYYSIGVNDVFAGITWSAPVRYTSGYNPSISVFGPASGVCSSTVVEAHQSASGLNTGPLFYRIGTINKAGTILGSSSPCLDGGSELPTLVWGPDVDTFYDTGCSPSVAATVIDDDSFVLETHAISCALPGTIFYSFGQISYY